MNFHILTLFPDMVMQGLMTSITGRAVQQNKITIEAVNIRDYTTDKHRKVDDYPYGGGAGMLMQAQPVYDAYQAVAKRLSPSGKRRVIYVTPQGSPFTQQKAQELSENEDLILLCGHYEGIDERVLEEIVTDYISIGDYVLTGGELAAMVIVDAVARLVPRVLNNEQSAQTESFHGNLLEYPQYSRPEIWHGVPVPQVLLSGDPRRIEQWRKQQAAERTRQRRPDLYHRYARLQQCKEFLLQQKLLHMDMIELISRGRAELIYWENGEVLLKESGGDTYYHSYPDIADVQSKPEGKPAAWKRRGYDKKIDLIVLHQKEMIPYAEQELGLHTATECAQAVYTRREKLPIRGLYQAEGTRADGLVIRRVRIEEYEQAAAFFDTCGSTEYLRKRIEKGFVTGAFYGEELAGYIGIHGEGSIGLLNVAPKYRRRQIAAALETYMANEVIESGGVPFVQIIVGNEPSVELQKKLGLCFSKKPVYWME